MLSTKSIDELYKGDKQNGWILVHGFIKNHKQRQDVFAMLFGAVVNVSHVTLLLYSRSLPWKFDLALADCLMRREL